MATYYPMEYIRNQILSLGESYVYIGHYNDNYDNIVCLRYYDSNIEDDISFGKSTTARHPNMQIFLRDTSYVTGWSRMETIRDYFKAFSYQSLSLYPKSDILNLGNDERNRAMLSLNFKLMMLEGNTLTV